MTQQHVIADLDGVLTRRDTFSAVVAGLLARNPERIPRAIPLARELFRTPHGPRRGALARDLVALGLRGLSQPEYAKLAARLGARWSTSHRWVMLDGVRVITSHIDAGARVVVATASEKQLVRAYLDGVGLRDVELVGSTVSGPDGMLTFTTHAYGVEKTRLLRDLNIPLGEALLYTDSVADLATAREVQSTVLVNCRHGEQFDAHNTREVRWR